MSMTDQNDRNKQPANSSASELFRAVKVVTHFQPVLTSASMAVLRNFRRTSNMEVRDGL